jgi:hypothetical protein
MKQTDMSRTAPASGEARPSAWVRVSRDRAEPPGRADSRQMASRAGGAVMTDASEPGTIRVLIADDQRVVREGLSMLVALLGDILTALPWF